MFRALTILTAVVALAVSAAPASAATSGTGVGRVGGKMHLDDVSMGVITNDNLPTTTGVWWSRR